MTTLASVATTACRVPALPCRAATRFEVRVVSGAELAPFVPAWQHLADHAVEPNPFYEPWMLLPALRSFDPDNDLRFVLIGDADTGPRAQLHGFFPLQLRPHCKRLPVRCLQLWVYDHCYLGVPLLRPETTEACLAAFFAWLTTPAAGAGLLEWPIIPADGAFHELLSTQCQAHALKTLTTEEWSRAFWFRTSDADTYLRAALSGTHRRQRQRLERRLAQQGTLTYRTLTPADDLTAWQDAFLSLEASGWKGRERTALACRTEDEQFFRAMTSNAFCRGCLLAHALHLDGQPLALRWSFRAGAGVFAFKTAFDERFARYSPGALLEMQIIREFCEQTALHWMDSCTSADNALLNRLLPARRRLRNVLMSTGHGLGDIVIRLLPCLRRGSSLLRQLWSCFP